MRRPCVREALRSSKLRRLPRVLQALRATTHAVRLQGGRKMRRRRRSTQPVSGVSLPQVSQRQHEQGRSVMQP